jgi:hypothetical protein
MGSHLQEALTFDLFPVILGWLLNTRDQQRTCVLGGKQVGPNDGWPCRGQLWLFMHIGSSFLDTGFQSRCTNLI